MSTKQPNQDADLSIVNRITDLLDQRNIKAKDFANAVGIHASAISEWKNGKTASYTKILPLIADFLQVDVNYLLGRKDTPTLEKPISNPRPDLVIPEILQQVGIGFNKGAENLTQEDIDDMALALELRRKRK